MFTINLLVVLNMCPIASHSVVVTVTGPTDARGAGVSERQCEESKGR